MKSNDLKVPEKAEDAIKGAQPGRGVMASPSPVISRAIELRVNQKARRVGS